MLLGVRKGERKYCPSLDSKPDFRGAGRGRGKGYLLDGESGVVVTNEVLSGLKYMVYLYIDRNFPSTSWEIKRGRGVYM